MNLVWTDRAKARLRDVLDFIAFDNPAAARVLARRVLAKSKRLEAFPLLGRPVPEFQGLPFRELVVPPCRVIYILREAQVVILTVIRSERLLTRGALRP
jgi:toxin ParE1/3/4